MATINLYFWWMEDVYRWDLSRGDHIEMSNPLVNSTRQMSMKCSGFFFFYYNNSRQSLVTVAIRQVL